MTNYEFLHNFVSDDTSGYFHSFDSYTFKGAESYANPESFLNEFVAAVNEKETILKVFGSLDFFSFNDDQIEKIIEYLAENTFIALMPVYTDGSGRISSTRFENSYIVGCITNYEYDTVARMKYPQYKREENLIMFEIETRIYNAIVNNDRMEYNAYKDYRKKFRKDTWGY